MMLLDLEENKNYHIKYYNKYYENNFDLLIYCEKISFTLTKTNKYKILGTVILSNKNDIKTGSKIIINECDISYIEKLD